MLVIFFSVFTLVQSSRVAIIGEGVIGLSTALALKEAAPEVHIDIYYEQPFEETISGNVAGLFRVDDYRNRAFGNATFHRLAKLWREVGGNSGVQLLSGHILSNNRQTLEKQEQNYGDVVYNFRYLNKKELHSQFVLSENDNSSAIHYTAFTAEGGRYCPYLKQILLSKDVNFIQRRIENFDELASEGYSVIVNCAGINGSLLARDDDETFPIRGVLLKVEAPWHKQFLYRDFQTYSIPMINIVAVGGLKQINRTDLTVTEDDLNDIWSRYTELQPAMKTAKVVGSYVGLRPGRTEIRLESQAKTAPNGNKYTVVHNYGHGGNGFTLHWGCALNATDLILKALEEKRETQEALEHFSV